MSASLSNDVFIKVEVRPCTFDQRVAEYIAEGHDPYMARYWTMVEFYGEPERERYEDDRDTE